MTQDYWQLDHLLSLRLLKPFFDNVLLEHEAEFIPLSLFFLTLGLAGLRLGT